MKNGHSAKISHYCRMLLRGSLDPQAYLDGESDCPDCHLVIIYTLQLYKLQLSSSSLDYVLARPPKKTNQCYSVVY